MYILGLNAYHADSAACLIKDGQLVAALEEERIRRVKHWAGLPTEAVKFCLNYVGISIKDVDYVAVSRDPWARFHKKIIRRLLLKRPSLSFIKERFGNLKKIESLKNGLAVELNIKENEFKAKIINVEHHRAHLASAFFVSPFDSAGLVSIDGFGDFASTMLGIGEKNKIKVVKTAEFPHSLGILYTAMTQFLGFWNFGDEYKVMGLSSFGKPDYLKEMHQLVREKNNGLFELDTSYFLHENQGVKMTWLNEKPVIDRLFSDKMTELLGKPRKENEELNQRFKDIAASLQAVYEEIFFYILNRFCAETGLTNLVLAGGCLQNSLANGKILKKTSFRKIYIPPAAYDAGTAVGAAYYLWNQILNNKRDFVMNSAFWGPEYNEKQIANSISLIASQKKFKIKKMDNEKLIKTAAEFLADGKIVGWFQGRTEWGPRALGNRSILANPCLANIKETLNLKIKKREPFRPFAPSVLEEAVTEYFEENEPAPFMEKVYLIKPKKRKKIPAVVHVDGTGRLQTVNFNSNPLYYNLIKEFGKLTGVPILLNTSFNENEPIVNKPKEAIDCFLRTKMDVLFLGNYLVARK